VNLQLLQKVQDALFIFLAGYFYKSVLKYPAALLLG
jgi:hypothetical protein